MSAGPNSPDQQLLGVRNDIGCLCGWQTFVIPAWSELHGSIGLTRGYQQPPPALISSSWAYGMMKRDSSTFPEHNLVGQTYAFGPPNCLKRFSLPKKGWYLSAYAVSVVGNPSLCLHVHSQHVADLVHEIMVMVLTKAHKPSAFVSRCQACMRIYIISYLHVS